MLVDTSSSLTHCVLSLLPHLIPYRRRCGLNNVIKPPHSLWPPPLPCCPAALSLFLSIIQRDEQQYVSSTTKQHQYEDQLTFTLCSEQIHCDEKRKREKYLMHCRGS